MGLNRAGLSWLRKTGSWESRKEEKTESDGIGLERLKKSYMEGAARETLKSKHLLTSFGRVSTVQIH